jgi:hypothetical protein
MLAKFFDALWGWADYRPKDWSNAPRFCSKLNRMEYRGIRYTLRTGIERGLWLVAIHPRGVETAENKVFGTREDAELQARLMIDRRLEPKSRQRSKLER